MFQAIAPGRATGADVIFSPGARTAWHLHPAGQTLIVLESGDSKVNVYRSDHAGTNEATAVTWAVDDIEREVDSLRRKGVMFEHYDMPGLALEGDVHVGGDMKVAWFKDPDGNILNIVEN